MDPTLLTILLTAIGMVSGWIVAAKGWQWNHKTRPIERESLDLQILLESKDTLAQDLAQTRDELHTALEAVEALRNKISGFEQNVVRLQTEHSAGQIEKSVIERENVRLREEVAHHLGRYEQAQDRIALMGQENTRSEMLRLIAERQRDELAMRYGVPFEVRPS